MLPINNIEEILGKINDPAAALAIICTHGALRLSNKSIQATLFRFGPIGFYLNTDRGLLSKNAKQRVRVPQPRPLTDGESNIFLKLDAGDVQVTIGPRALHTFDESVASCDLLELIDWPDVNEVRAFISEAFEKIFATKVTQPFDQRLGTGMLFVSRTFLDQKSEVAQRTYAFFLREALIRLDLQTIVDEARIQGDDPLCRAQGPDRANEYDATQSVIEYTFKFLLESPYCGADGLCEALDQMLRLEHAFLLNHLEALCLVASYARKDCGQEVADRFAGAFAKDIVRRWLAVPNSGYWVPMIESLAKQCHLWHGIPAETFEEALVDVIANGDFANIYGFMQVTRWSSFLPGRSTDNNDANYMDKVLKDHDRIRAYLRELLPRIFARSIEFGRLDVASALAKHFKKTLDVPAEYRCDLHNLADGLTGKKIYGDLNIYMQSYLFSDLEKEQRREAAPPQETPSDPTT